MSLSNISIANGTFTCGTGPLNSTTVSDPVYPTVLVTPDLIGIVNSSSDQSLYGYIKQPESLPVFYQYPLTPLEGVDNQITIKISTENKNGYENISDIGMITTFDFAPLPNQTSLSDSGQNEGIVSVQLSIAGQTGCYPYCDLNSFASHATAESNGSGEKLYAIKHPFTSFNVDLSRPILVYFFYDEVTNKDIWYINANGRKYMFRVNRVITVYKLLDVNTGYYLETYFPVFYNNNEGNPGIITYSFDPDSSGMFELDSIKNSGSPHFETRKANNYLCLFTNRATAAMNIILQNETHFTATGSVIIPIMQLFIKTRYEVYCMSFFNFGYDYHRNSNMKWT